MAWKNFTRDGYTEFRYGTSKPVTLAGPKPAPVYSRDQRKAVVSKALDILRDWRRSPFEHEGAVRSGLRSGLCVSGYSWERSDAAAAEIVAESLRRLGAKRPTWEQGQREYVECEDVCIHCRSQLETTSMDPWRHTYCSKVCRDAHRLKRDSAYRYHETYAVKRAYQVAAISKLPRRSCINCGADFQPGDRKTKHCSLMCARHSRLDIVPDKNCEACGNVFRGRSIASRYCSIQCIADAERASLKQIACEHCAARFQPGKAATRFCSKKCQQAAHHLRTRAARPQSNPLPMKTCVSCGQVFQPVRKDGRFCSKRCNKSYYNAARSHTLKCERA